MADEITVVSGIKVLNGNLSYQQPNRTQTFTQTTARFASFTQDIGTSEENIDFGDVVPGWVRISNLDSTNFVRLRFSTGANAIRLVAGQGFFEGYIDGVTVIAIADTAACKIQVEAANT